ncbi:hypothetical protein KM043_000277 [Ampulex compressa]|nr:hypothetical protein KM043_000277 [Ampulex compressa]
MVMKGSPVPRESGQSRKNREKRDEDEDEGEGEGEGEGFGEDEEEEEEEEEDKDKDVDKEKEGEEEEEKEAGAFGEGERRQGQRRKERKKKKRSSGQIFPDSSTSATKSAAHSSESRAPSKVRFATKVLANGRARLATRLRAISCLFPRGLLEEGARWPEREEAPRYGSPRFFAARPPEHSHGLSSAFRCGSGMSREKGKFVETRLGLALPFRIAFPSSAKRRPDGGATRKDRSRGASLAAAMGRTVETSGFRPISLEGRALPREPPRDASPGLLASRDEGARSGREGRAKDDAPIHGDRGRKGEEAPRVPRSSLVARRKREDFRTDRGSARMPDAELVPLLGTPVTPNSPPHDPSFIPESCLILASSPSRLPASPPPRLHASSPALAPSRPARAE